jgi:hypothetical protein
MKRAASWAVGFLVSMRSIVSNVGRPSLAKMSLSRNEEASMKVSIQVLKEIKHLVELEQFLGL